MTATTYAGRRPTSPPPVATPDRRSRLATLVLVVVLGLALALIVAGVFIAVDTATPRAASSAVSPFAVGQSLATRSGRLEVTSVERTGGLSANDLSGANHGISGLVNEDQAQVQVSVRLTNTTGKALRYTPSQLRLRSGTTRPAGPASSTLPVGSLSPGAELEGTLGFVVGRTGSALLLEVPGLHGTEFVDLGTTDKAAPGTGHAHH